MDECPMEVTTHILSKLPITSVFGCRSVCKTWCSIIDNPQFPNLHFHDYVSKSKNPSSSSFILVPTSTTYQVKLYDLEDLTFVAAFLGVSSSSSSSISNLVLTSSKIDIPPNLSKDSPMININTVGSSHGLICLSSLQSTPNNPNLYVYNPVIREHVQLPLPHNNFVISIKASGFGFDPSTNEFKVVLICQWRQWNEGEEEEGMDEEEYGPIQSVVQVYSFREGRRLGGIKFMPKCRLGSNGFTSLDFWRFLETAKIFPEHLVTYTVLGQPGDPHYAHYDMVEGRGAVDQVYPCMVEFLSKHG